MSSATPALEQVPILVTQRFLAPKDSADGVGRDALDQDWHPFLRACGLTPLLVPNDRARAAALAREASWNGLLLTGGNDLTSFGGDAVERDAVELALIEEALSRGRPVLGICRGMQLLLEREGARHVRVRGHVAEEQTIRIDGEPAKVNSYHRFGLYEAPASFRVYARSEDGVVKAVVHREAPLRGLMWHPERRTPARAEDVRLFRDTFGAFAPDSAPGNALAHGAPTEAETPCKG